MARNETNEPNRLISAAVGVAMPTDCSTYGYLSEHHAFGEKAIISGEYAEDLAATMLATTHGIPFDPNQAWDERKQVYIASDHIFKTKLSASLPREIKTASGLLFSSCCRLHHGLRCQKLLPIFADCQVNSPPTLRQA